MSNMIENTLFLGNGFSKAIFKGVPNWRDLLNSEHQWTDAVTDNTILYEINFINEPFNGRSEAQIKDDLVKCLKNTITIQNIKETISNLDKFGAFLAENNISNIITTNYDRGIEQILCELCGYRENVMPTGLIKETIYSVRTYKEFVSPTGSHILKLWKIHGDIDRPISITLGFDHYCGALSKLSNYIKGNYRSDDQGESVPACNVTMENKCIKREFDHLSWAELFFRTNVYIVGFGMAFSEIDIWWLLNKRSRIEKSLHKKYNSIYYLYNEIYDNLYEMKDTIQALESFGVVCSGIRSDEKYIKNIFDKMKKSDL